MVSRKASQFEALGIWNTKAENIGGVFKLADKDKPSQIFSNSFSFAFGHCEHWQTQLMVWRGGSWQTNMDARLRVICVITENT